MIVPINRTKSIRFNNYVPNFLLRQNLKEPSETACFDCHNTKNMGFKLKNKKIKVVVGLMKVG